MDLLIVRFIFLSILFIYLFYSCYFILFLLLLLLLNNHNKTQLKIMIVKLTLEFVDVWNIVPDHTTPRAMTHILLLLHLLLVSCSKLFGFGFCLHLVPWSRIVQSKVPSSLGAAAVNDILWYPYKDMGTRKWVQNWSEYVHPFDKSLWQKPWTKA